MAGARRAYSEVDMSRTTVETHEPCAGCLSRRDVLVRGGMATMSVAAVGVLAACGGSTGSSGSGDGTVATPDASGALAQVADIPVGGALSATATDGSPIILVQPSAGTVVALSAVCTHQGCTVAVDGDQLACPCHGSVFTLEGANVSGPAPKPLPAFDVHVSEGAVLEGAA
ncbi:iron-sulfur protein [Cellulomonas soli]|uniref:Cytochrome bc1 complex Rieske iron-sulfur subunit n=2 Tax=Cellulomonas soli TaxID=931535 RepID=A0A512PI50_9CELL|nr:iron-sulfur protein [Cellulomonas soli]